MLDKILFIQLILNFFNISNKAITIKYEVISKIFSSLCNTFKMLAKYAEIYKNH